MIVRDSNPLTRTSLALVFAGPFGIAGLQLIHGFGELLMAQRDEPARPELIAGAFVDHSIWQQLRELPLVSKKTDPYGFI